MKALQSIFVRVILTVFLFSCHYSDVLPTTTGTWDKLGDFAGLPRGNAVEFVINNIAYVGTGYNYGINQQLKDFWRYDKSADAWTPIADFPGVARSFAVAFSLNEKGYVGLGYDGTNSLSDFYQYDPTQNKWSRIADFGTSSSLTTALPRFGAIGFSMNGKAFVGSGSANTPDAGQDFWQYDDAQNQWQRIQDMGQARRNGWAMIIGNSAYIGGGSSNGVVLNDFWKFDPSTTDPWIRLEKNGVQPPSRELASTFIIGQNGYLSFGSNNTKALDDAWKYSPPPINQWTQISYKVTSSGSTWGSMNSRVSGIGFSIENVGYLTTGNGDRRSICFDDCWLFKP